MTSWALESAAGLGPSAVVVAVAALGRAAAVRYGHAVRRVTLITFVIVAVTGLGWIELINTAQYGTLALTGAPPLVRWCGATYKPSGVVTSELSTGPGAVHSTILRTPSGYDVFGVALAGRPLLCHERAALRRRGPGALRGSMTPRRRHPPLSSTEGLIRFSSAPPRCR